MRVAFDLLLICMKSIIIVIVNIMRANANIKTKEPKENKFNKFDLTSINASK